MSNSYFIITGTSRGIGEALAKMLLDDGHYIFGISRGVSDVLMQYENYTHNMFDLSESDNIEQLLTSIFEQIDSQEIDMICLINNAAMLEPLKPIEECQAEEINKNLHISLIAPIILSSCFIRQTENLNARRKIVNISSGAGVHPLEDMSIYCTAKAGLNMFTRCIGVEQTGNRNSVEIIAVDPGMVETAMQKTVRGKDVEDFAMAGFFKEAYINGELQSPEHLVADLTNIIEKKYETGKIMNHFEG
jgi:benzil reductase ((S)-benzoin forming)